MSLKGKKVYTRKNGGSLYKWAPIGDKKKYRKDSGPDANLRTDDGFSLSDDSGDFCTAVAYSESGEDKNTGYVVQHIIVDGKMTYEAYVACDYVE